MSMSVLISDKSVPFASVLAGSLRARNASVALLCGIPEDTVPGRKESADPSALCEIPWNRSSDLSARTVLLEIRNCFGPLDQAVLVFDLPVFAERLTATAGHAAVIDEYIKGYLLLALEIVSLFVRGKKGRLVFVVRGRQPESRPPAGLALAVAEAAFIRLAEETAASIAATGLAQVQSLLVKLEGITDDEAASWLVEQLFQANAPRSQTRWIKAGTKGLLALI